jgi:putative hydrolase of the HAD superfamily
MKKIIVFDLDDTLIKELDYLKSAFFEIANHLDANAPNLYNQMLKWYFDRQNVFANLQKLYSQTTIEELKYLYRNHFPNLSQYSYVKDFLTTLSQKGFVLGLITDGYSVTQRNKIKALGIENLFDLIVISEEFGTEKPNEANYNTFHKFGTNFCYVGDNLKKDFVSPNLLGWQTICILDNGSNIHKQDFRLSKSFLPSIYIEDLKELVNYI